MTTDQWTFLVLDIPDSPGIHAPTLSDIILPEMVLDFMLRYCCRTKVFCSIFTPSGAIWPLWKFAERKYMLQTPYVWGINSFANKISNGLWVQVESQLQTIRVAVQTLLCPKQSLYPAGHQKNGTEGSKGRQSRKPMMHLGWQEPIVRF